MGDSIPSLKEIKDSIMVFVIFSLFAISFWTWFYYNVSNIIELLLKNIWTMMLLFIIFWIIPSLFVYIIANSLNKNVSFLRSLGVSLLSNILYILISLTIFYLFPYINQISAIPILFILAIILLIVFIIIFKCIFNVNWIDAFNIASRYAFISSLIIILVVFAIIFNLG